MTLNLSMTGADSTSHAYIQYKSKRLQRGLFSVERIRYIVDRIFVANTVIAFAGTL